MGRATRKKEDASTKPPATQGTTQDKVTDTGANRDKKPGTSDKLDAILAAIAKLDTKINTVVINLNLLRVDQKKVVERVTRVETEVAALYQQTTELKLEVAELSKRLMLQESGRCTLWAVLVGTISV